MVTILSKRRVQIVVGLLPLLIPFAAVIGCGLLVTVLQSFGLMMFSYTYDDLLFGYRELSSDDWFIRSVVFSLYVSTASALLSVCIGTTLAYQLWRLPSRYHSWMVMYKIPLVLPHIAVGFLAVIILSKTGIISSLFHKVGTIETLQEFPSLLHSPLGIGLITSYVYKEAPFVLLMVYSVLCRFDQRQIETARMLGSSGTRIFLKLILPFIMPVLHTVFIILFVYTFGGFDLPFVIGDSYPGMLSIRVYDYFFQKDITLRPVAMAMLTLMFSFSLIFIVLYLKFSSRLEKEMRKL